MLRLIRADGAEPYAERPTAAKLTPAARDHWPTIDPHTWHPILACHRDGRHVWLPSRFDCPVLVPRAECELRWPERRNATHPDRE